MSGYQLDCNPHCKTEFGAHCQTHEDPDFKNNVQTMHTTDAMCVGPTGDLQGNHCFHNMDTGKQIRRTEWTEMPMLKTIIVEKLVKIGEQQKVVEGLKFSDRNGNLKEHVPPDDSNVAGVCDDSFIETEDVDMSVFDEVEEVDPQEDHESDGDLVEGTEEPTVETTQENEEPELEHENPPELETAQDEPEDSEPEVDPVEEPQDTYEAPEKPFEPSRRSTRNTSPPEKLDLSTKGQTHGSLRSHSFTVERGI